MELYYQVKSPQVIIVRPISMRFCEIHLRASVFPPIFPHDEKCRMEVKSSVTMSSCIVETFDICLEDLIIDIFFELK